MPPTRSPLAPLAVGCALAGLTVLLYLRALDCDFVNYDDPRYITANLFVQQGLTWESLRWAFTANADYWHPLTWISHMADWEVYGASAAGHHLTSVLWHAANAALVFLVVRRLSGAFWSSAVIAALFAWHPLRVESVAWVTERKDVMSGFFMLLTVWAYVEYTRERRLPAQSARSRRCWMWYSGVLAAYGASLMSKPSAVTLPLALLALDFWRIDRPSTGRAVAPTPPPSIASILRIHLLDKLPLLAMAAVTAAATVRMQNEAGAFTLQLPFAARLANVPVAIMRYLGKHVWPQKLAVCYPHPGWWPPAIALGSAAAVLLMTWLAWKQRDRRPWLILGWAWFLVLLLPMAGIVQVGFQSIADRYTYFPTLGVLIAVTFTLREYIASGRARRITAVLAILVLGALSCATWRQQGVWRDSITLFRHAVAVTDRNDVAEGFLAYTLVGQGDFAGAEPHAVKALELNPHNDTALFTLGGIRATQNRYAEAIRCYERVLEINPRDPLARTALAVLLVREGRMDTAEAQFQAAVKQQPELIATNRDQAMADLHAGRMAAAAARLQLALTVEPDEASLHFGLARALGRLGRDQDAVRHYERVLALQPDLPEAHVELGLARLRAGDPSGARAHFTAAVGSRAGAAAAVGLGRAEEQLGHRSEADAAFARALTEAPNNAEVCRAWAEVLARRGRFSDAATYYRRSAALAPNDPATHMGLGYVLLLSGRKSEAAAAWREALRLNPALPGLRERLDQLAQP